MDKMERKALSDIKKYGCHILHVAEEGDAAPFSYTIGLEQTSGSPEGVVIGLRHEVAHFVLNEYNRRIRAGETFVPGRRYSGFLEGFDIAIEQVELVYYPEFFGWGLWLYKGPNFRVVQLVCPNMRGVWPWDRKATLEFRRWQPVLTPRPRTPAKKKLAAKKKPAAGAGVKKRPAVKKKPAAPKRARSTGRTRKGT